MESKSDHPLPYICPNLSSPECIIRVVCWFLIQLCLFFDLGLGLKAKFCGLGLATGWPSPWDFDLGLRGLVLAKNSRPTSWQTRKFTINFHPLENGDWSELYFKIQFPYLLTVGNHGLVRVHEINRIS